MWHVAAQSLQSIKTILTLKLSQYCKSGSTFSSSEPVTALSVVSNCRLLENTVCLILPIQPAQAVLASEQAQPLI